MLGDPQTEYFVEEQTDHVIFGYRVTKKILEVQSPYQFLEVFDTEVFGKLMTLDGKVMLTEKDEFYYHEMLVHPSMLAHPNPRRVALIGGGDGGAVREILKHPSVEEVIWVEIDGAVVEAARDYFPSVSREALADPRVKLSIAPGEEVMGQYEDYFDVLLVDSTDPIGPAVPLFEAPFFKMCQRSLKSDGIYACQCGSPRYYPEEQRSVSQQLRQVFAHQRFYVGFIPMYPSGFWSFVMAAQQELAVDGGTITDRFEAAKLGETCQYLTPELYAASAVLPRFVKDLVS